MTCQDAADAAVSMIEVKVGDRVVAWVAATDRFSDATILRAALALLDAEARA